MNQPNIIELYPERKEVSPEPARLVCLSQPTWVFDQETIRHAQKMEAMGRLAAGVAHDFYNILTVIQGYAALMTRGQRTKEEINEQLNHISSAASRGAILTRQLLAYSRRDPVQFEALDLNALIENMASMLTRLLGENITLRARLGSNLNPVAGDRGMIEQLLMNLVVNARDAIDANGSIAISTDLVQITQTHVAMHPEAKVGNFVCLGVCDTGSGMTKEVLARLFEPFFTTKDAHKGTGLGLAMARGIVEQHSGWIEVRSQVRVGTEFKIYFPCAPNVASHKKGKPHLGCIASGDETILVVENDAELRGLVAYILKFHGYRVIVADGAEQALALWSKHSATVDLALIDVAPPSATSGDQLAERLRQTKPELKVVYTSGHSTQPVAPGEEIRGRSSFVAKPFLPDTLVQAVQDSLANCR